MLGLNALAGQKSVVARTVTRTDPAAAAKYFEAAKASGVLPASLLPRLEETLQPVQRRQQGRFWLGRDAESQATQDVEAH